MKWYQMKEQAAGEKRLMLLWYLYKLFGKHFVCFFVYFIAFFAFCFSREIRTCTNKNLSVIYAYTKNPKSRPTLLNRYRNVLNYALSLVDRMESYTKNFPVEKIKFDNIEQKEETVRILKQNTGIFFICSHIGNIDIMRSFIDSPKNRVNPHVNIFLSEEHCKIFNNFLKKIQAKTDADLFPVEQIDINTSIELKEKADNGDIIFIAGDRISSGNSSISVNAQFLGKKIELPAGTFKLAQLMEIPVYFVCALKTQNDTYTIYFDKFENDEKLSKSQNFKNMYSQYTLFLEKMAETAPLQFYHFYDLFDD